MAIKPKSEGWLPPLQKHMAPKLHELLDSLASNPPNENHQVERQVQLILEEALQANATDAHFDPNSNGLRIRYRIDGELHDIAELPPEMGLRVVRRLKSLAGLDPVAAFRPQDAHAKYNLGERHLDCRIACVPAQYGEKLALRILDTYQIDHRIPHLGMADQTLAMLNEWMIGISGLCIVTGPTGSGKTTTLYALLHELKLSSRSIVTIEDPVEYQIDGITQIQVDERHGLTFTEGLRTMQRLDPDYQLVGEIRDVASAHAAVEASGNGRALMTTLHSRDTVGVITMLRNWDVHEHEIASAVEIVIAQRLIRKLCVKCRREEKPTAKETVWLKSFGAPVPKKTWHAQGCQSCLNTGYKGRTGVFEIWRREESDYELILQHADEQSIRKNLRARNLPSLLDDGLQKARDGITTISQIRMMGAQTSLYARLQKPPSSRKSTSKS